MRSERTSKEAPSAAVLVVFNHVPDLPSLEAAIRCVNVLMLVDNHSNPGVVSCLRSFVEKHPERCILVENEENIGVSRAYNLAFTHLQKMGIYWTYLLDHDAVFDDCLFLETQTAWKEVSKTENRIGVIVPIVSDDPSSMGSNLGLRQKYSTVRSTITSGIMTNTDVLAELHGFDENVFVDGADFEFTSRARLAGLRLVRINRVLIVQQFETKPESHTSVMRLLNVLLRFRSSVRVAIGNANIWRTTASIYPIERSRTMVTSLRHVGEVLPQARKDLAVIRLFNYLEALSISLALKLNPSGRR